MQDTIVKLKDIIGRDVCAAEASAVVEHLLACLTHVTNARPLFGVLNTNTAALEWTAGGADFYDVLGHLDGDGHAGSTGFISFMQLFMCFGICSSDLVAVIEQMNALAPDSSVSLVQPMAGAQDRYFRMVLRRRSTPNEALVQFSLLDITAFQLSAKRTQSMAQALVARLDETATQAQLLAVLDGLDALFALHDDDAIRRLAADLSAQVTMVSERMVELLRGFEDGFDTSHWQPIDLEPVLRPVINVHSAPVCDWQQLHREVMIEADADGDPALRGIDADSFKNAYDFVTYAASTLVISPTQGSYFLLNGPAGGQGFARIEDFVRALGVEENSTRTAIEYFSGLGDKPALGVFAMEGLNVEAWGRPGAYGGWQAMLVPTHGGGVDVRGMFHGLKNLLLHLQVLYVVKNRGDVDQVLGGLTESAQKIRRRLDEFGAIARTGRRVQRYDQETVGQWLAAAARVGDGGEGEVLIAADGVAHLRVPAMPGEMEDTLEELVRNAFVHGAKTVRVGAMRHHDHLCILISDDGSGMSDDKLAQLRRVLHSRDYDATLSTRKGGSGNGLLSAARAVSRFVDGRLSVDHGPDGCGVEIKISLKLPG